MACFLELDDYIAWILHMKTLDADYAREALIWYDQQLPDMRLMEGVRAALRAESGCEPDADCVGATGSRLHSASNR